MGSSLRFYFRSPVNKAGISIILINPCGPAALRESLSLVANGYTWLHNPPI